MEEEEGLALLKKKGIVAVCLGISWYHALRFMWYYGPLLRRGDLMYTPFFEDVLTVSLFAVLLLVFLATLWLKNRLLKRKIAEHNMLSAFKSDQHGDLESALAGTKSHEQVARDVTNFAFIAWPCLYALFFLLRLFLDLYQGFYSDLLTILFAAIITVLFAVAFIMNLGILHSATRRRTKSIIP